MIIHLKLSAISDFVLALTLISYVIVHPSCTTQKDKDPVEKSQQMVPEGSYPAPEGTPAELGLAGCAKVLCSAVFVSGRNPDEASKNSGYFFLPEELQDDFEYILDMDDRSLFANLGDSLRARAKYFGDQGCIIQPLEGDKLHFNPEIIRSHLPDASSTAWPMGDSIPSGTSALEYDKVLMQAAVDSAFSPEEALTAAFMVVFKGHIVAERYMEGIDLHTQLESWSMGKSLTSTLIGRMIRLGYFDLDDPAPIEEWQSDNDPRSKITIRDLLRMSSGLYFTSHHDPELVEYTRYLDHFYIYTGAVNAFTYSINRPLQFLVGSTGRYRNCDPLSLGLIMKRTLTEKGESYLAFPQKELFDKIGIREQVLETDPYGNFLLTGYDYGTARNWARLGLLYLNEGNWHGTQLLPEYWTDFVSTPAPGWEIPEYGGLFWLNRTGELPMPQDAYYMAGGGGQRTIIVPSLELIIVRLGHFRGSEVGMESLNRACELVIRAVEM